MTVAALLEPHDAHARPIVACSAVYDSWRAAGSVTDCLNTLTTRSRIPGLWVAHCASALPVASLFSLLELARILGRVA